MDGTADFCRCFLERSGSFENYLMDRAELLITQNDNEKNQAEGDNYSYKKDRTKCFYTALALPAAIFFHLPGEKSTKGNVAWEDTLTTRSIYSYFL
ncbi:MAG: hypothetical protein D3910_11960 [Candidatus Electrothrix sp. ATG2]|nr:hypothetical protein [Candidatus Electrothrix sp. ATG2]